MCNQINILLFFFCRLPTLFDISITFSKENFFKKSNCTCKHLAQDVVKILFLTSVGFIYKETQNRTFSNYSKHFVVFQLIFKVKFVLQLLNFAFNFFYLAKSFSNMPCILSRLYLKQIKLTCQHMIV